MLKLDSPYQIIHAGGEVGLHIATLVVTKGFQWLLTHIEALKEQFKTIPVIVDSDKDGIR